MSILQRLGQGIQNLPNSLGSKLFPVDPAMVAGMTPQQLTALRRSALLRTGLGLSGAARSGLPFGAAALAGIDQGDDLMQQYVRTAFVNATNARRDRLVDERTKTEDQRYAEDRAYRLQKDQQALDQRTADQEAADRRWKAEQEQQDRRATAQEKLTRDEMAQRERIASLKLDEPPYLRPVPSPIARAIVENRQNLGKLDRALEAVVANPDAFGAQNYAPDALTQRLNGPAMKGGLDARAKVADIGSLIIHDRSGAAVTVSEFPRLKPFIPVATDTPKTVETKLKNLRTNLAGVVDDLEGTYSPETGYMPIWQPGAAQNPGATVPPMLARPGSNDAVAQRAQGYY